MSHVDEKSAASGAFGTARLPGALEALNVTEAARRLGVSRKQLSDIVNCHAGISPEMAIQLDRAFGGGAGTWLRLQAAYDLAQAMKRADAIKVERLHAEGEIGGRVEVTAFSGFSSRIGTCQTHPGAFVKRCQPVSCGIHLVGDRSPPDRRVRELVPKASRQGSEGTNSHPGQAAGSGEPGRRAAGGWRHFGTSDRLWAGISRVLPSCR